MKININTASKALLAKLPGVGPKIAEKIIQERNISKFTSIEDIQRVKGIGPKKYEEMKSNLKIK